MTGKPTFSSMGGRTLYGGGGITPDLLVLPDTLTTNEQGAIRKLSEVGGGFFASLQNFAVEYIGERTSLRQGFRVTDADLRAFGADLRDRGAGIDDESLFAAERFVRYHLGREIALQAWGEAGEFLRDVPDDRQLQQALDLLKEASSQEALFTLAGTPLPGQATQVGGSD